MKIFVKKAFVTIFIIAIFVPITVSAEELTFVSVNSWAGLEYKGFISCKEYETENDRNFRHEVLLSGLETLKADVIVLNGINPANQSAADGAEKLGMNYLVQTSRSGLRIGPVSLPLNLREGDAIFTNKALETEAAGRIHMNGSFSNNIFTLFSRKGVQVLGQRVKAGDAEFYVFSAVWTESLFNDAKSLGLLLEGYLKGDISSEDYPLLIEDAVSGAEIRAAQAAETLSFINKTAGESPVILMGSLNALPDSKEISLLKNAGFSDVYQKVGRGKGNTIDLSGNSNYEKIPEGSGIAESLNGDYRADYILIRGEGVNPVSAEVVLNVPVYGVYPSNRYGIKAVIKLPARPSE
jgi:hypothetical protein